MRSEEAGWRPPRRETQNQPFQVPFRAPLKIDFQGSRLASEDGLGAVREHNQRLGFGEIIGQHLTDSRAKNARLPSADLLRQSVSWKWVGKAAVQGLWDSPER